MNTCPGSNIPLLPGVLTTVTGNNSGFGPLHGGSCAGSIASQLVYSVNLLSAGLLQLILHPSGYLGALYVREACTTPGSELGGGCVEGFMPGETLFMPLSIPRAGTYHIFADGSNGGAGAFALDMLWQPNGSCGDRALTNREQCDDGNGMNGDGCSGSCNLEGAPTNTCPGRTLRLSPGIQVYSGTTIGATGAWTQPCATTGPDQLYQLNITGGTSLRIDVNPTSSRFDPVINVHGTGCMSTAGAICLDAAPIGIFETTTLPVTPGMNLWLTVDSGGTTVGPYVIRFTLM